LTQYIYTKLLLITGKWVYEVLLGSKGVMQIGWCTLKCRFSAEVHYCLFCLYMSYDRLISVLAKFVYETIYLFSIVSIISCIVK